MGDQPTRRAPVASIPRTSPVAVAPPSGQLRSKPRRGTIAAWGVGFAMVVAGLVWIAATPLPPRSHPDPPWFSAVADGYRIDMPTVPATSVVAFGAGHVMASVDGPDAFVVVWFPTGDGSDPLGVLGRAVQALATTPAHIVSVRQGHTGPFPSADVDARLSAAYLHGRLLVIGRRTYLVGEITPGASAPPELTRLLSGFDPDPAAA